MMQLTTPGVVLVAKSHFFLPNFFFDAVIDPISQGISMKYEIAIYNNLMVPLLCLAKMAQRQL